MNANSNSFAPRICRKKKHIDSRQTSFFELFDADENTYEAICVAKYDLGYELRFSTKVAYEMIHDSLVIMTNPRSNLQQRIDEIIWFLSDENQDDMCSFTNCCVLAGLDPYEVRLGVLHRWKNEIEFTDNLINTNHWNAPSNIEFVECARLGYKKYKTAFYIVYPLEAAKRKVG